MDIVEHRRQEYLVSTDKARLDIAAVQDFLNNGTYWARNRSLETITKSVENSLCFGLYRGDEQVGFARVVTDYATFAWLCDVIILEAHRGRGLGKWLIQCVVDHPSLQHMLFLLATRDAQDLYTKYGRFRPVDNPDRWMVK